MARAFLAGSDGHFSCFLEADEKAVVAQVAQEVIDLMRMDLGMREVPEALADASESSDPLRRLEAEMAGDGAGREPEDPAVKRLLPNLVEGDEAAAREYRRLSQQDLVKDKTHALACVCRVVDSTGNGPVELMLDRGEALLWLRALTDMRLVLAERMGVRNEDDFEMLQMFCQQEVEPETQEDDELPGVDYLATVYEFFSWLQESLLRAICENRPEG
ncbi:DUF2017 family protein [Dermabacteraceae bacterium P13101]